MAYQLNCRDTGADCDFMIRSEDKDELVTMVKQHAKKIHDMDMSRSEITDGMTEA